MLITLESCPSCGHQSFQYHITCEDYTVTHEQFKIVRCELCTLLFTNPRPSTDSLNKYYHSKEYISHTNTATNLIGIIYKAVRSITLNSKLKLINNLAKKGHLLDYGCGTGHFLNTMNKDGWDVTGVEPNSSARNNLPNHLNDKVTDDIANTPDKQNFDVITLWHVLEHIADLRQTLTDLVNRLETSGKLVIAVPNPQSYDAKLYGKYWAAYDLPRHLYHFTPISIAHLVESFNLQIDSVHPMKFDSFYVSLLSEKYKKGKSNYLKSFLNGYKSNSYANKNGSNYSSLIYIISKK